MHGGMDESLLSVGNQQYLHISLLNIVLYQATGFVLNFYQLGGHLKHYMKLYTYHYASLP